MQWMKQNRIRWGWVIRGGAWDEEARRLLCNFKPCWARRIVMLLGCASLRTPSRQRPALLKA
eukprot:403126-Amphidinium_carterae.2